MFFPSTHLGPFRSNDSAQGLPCQHRCSLGTVVCFSVAWECWWKIPAVFLGAWNCQGPPVCSWWRNTSLKISTIFISGITFKLISKIPCDARRCVSCDWDGSIPSQNPYGSVPSEKRVYSPSFLKRSATPLSNVCLRRRWTRCTSKWRLVVPRPRPACRWRGIRVWLGDDWLAAWMPRGEKKKSHSWDKATIWPLPSIKVA